MDGAEKKAGEAMHDVKEGAKKGMQKMKKKPVKSD